MTVRANITPIAVEFMPLGEAVERAFGGEIQDAPTALALMLAERKLRIV